MATIKEVLTDLRETFVDVIDEELEGDADASKAAIHAYDRSIGAVLGRIIDGTLAPAEPPKKRTYTRKPKPQAPPAGEN